jgi:hypothetical protein
MQAQARSDTAPSNPDIPSHKWLNLCIAFASVLLLSGLVMASYTLYVDVLHPHYHYIHEFHESYPTNKVKDRGITWELWLPALVFGLIEVLLFGLIKLGRNQYWFREILEGKIVNEHEHMSLFGARFYYFDIEGKNRAGETRKVKREVGQKKYFDYDVGDKISFKKE